MRGAVRLCFGLCVALSAPVAFAQAETKAASVLAYDEAERLMSEGKFADACLKYAESQRLDPQLGTLLHLADCFEQNGQTASAWASFREAAELAEKRMDPRRELAEQRIATLTPKLSKLQIEVPPGTDTSSLHIARDNVVVGAALWGAPIPTDPGPHTITVSAPGRRPWTARALVKADGSTTVIRVPELEREVPASPETSATPSTQKNEARVDSTSRATDADVSPLARRWPALAAGGLGLVGIGLGTVFGLQSKSKRDDAERYCDGKNCNDQRGVDLKDEAISAGNISTIGFIVGGVGLAAGTVLWFALPASGSAEAKRGLRVGLGAGTMTLERMW